MRKVIIMGAGGRDFHDFNVIFRNDLKTRVVAFTAAQSADPVKIRLSWVAPVTNWASIMLEKKDLAQHLGKSYTLEPVRFAGTPPMVVIRSRSISSSARSRSDLPYRRAMPYSVTTQSTNARSAVTTSSKLTPPGSQMGM